MKILLDCYIYYDVDSFRDALKMDVKFKLPNKFFKIKKTVCLANTTWGEWKEDKFIKDFLTMEEFYDYCINIVTDKEYLEETVIKMFNKYIKDQEDKLIKSNKKDKLKKLLNDKKSFQMEVEVSK